MSSEHGTYRIAVIRGDAKGVEVVEEGLKVLRAAGERFGVNWEFTESVGL